MQADGCVNASRAARLATTQVVSWIDISTSPFVVPPNTMSEVSTITLDATNLATGIHTALLCADSADEDGDVLLPVTFTVSAGDPVFEDGFESPGS